MLFLSALAIAPLLHFFHEFSVAHGQNVGHGSSFRASVLNPGKVGVSDVGNLIYLVNITVGGEDFTVQLDTGSTDLWVDGRGRNIKLTNSTGITATESYGVGSASGTIAFAEVKLADFVIASQVFVDASEVKNFSQGIHGILGMAFDDASIYETLQGVWGKEAADRLGDAFITNLFAQNPSSPNNFDVQLGRITFKDPAGTSTFTIGEHAPGFEAVAEAPKLPRVAADHWTLALDEMRIDGNPFQFNKSIVLGAPEGKVLAVLDTGFSLPPLPKPAVDAIYSKIPGAVLFSSSTNAFLNGWVLPCNFNPVSLSFTFGGREYPVHPLDLFLPVVMSVNDNGTEKPVTVCVAAYRALALDARFNSFDLILGDAFLRSVYASFDYGDRNPSNGEPFVQMVSTVDAQTAKTEFDEFISDLSARYPPFFDPSTLITEKLSLSPR